MVDQYVFELQFKGKADGSDYRENQFVIIDGSSMADFSRLKEDLAMCMPEPFTVQYIDDEDDVISIDTEEEFQEFAKIAKKRSSRGMLMRLILNSTLPLDHGHFMSPPGLRETNRSGNLVSRSRRQRHRFQEGLEELILSSGYRSHRQQLHLKEFKEKIKAELRSEILSELKEMGPGSQASAATVHNSISDAAGSTKESGRMEEDAKEAENEDSDGLVSFTYVINDKSIKDTKPTNYLKRLEKKEKLVEAKIDQRLEKLELKRKKLMEKYGHHKMVSRKPVVDAKVSLPMIISAIATKESSEMSKPVTATKMFTHVWTIVNDGTVPLNNVELRHTWSSPGLVPEKGALMLVPLLPGQQYTLAVRFKAPLTHNSSFISYWSFFRLTDDSLLWKEFGHYVSLSGSTKPLKSTAHDFADSKAFESNKKAKHEEKKVVSFMEAVDAVAAVAEAPREPQKEEKVLNEESLSNITLKKQMQQLQASLASSEIAADMAREAARLLAMASAAEGNTAPGHAAPKPSEGDKLNNCGLEEAAAGVQQLNLVDSESDTDANMETNEDDRGFVIVNMTPQQTGEETDKFVAKEDGTTTAPTDNNTKEAQPEPMAFPRLDPNVTYPVFPPPPHRVVNPPVFTPQSFYNYPVFPPTPNASSHGIVFPPPVNYSQIPTYPPIPTFHHPHHPHHPPGVPIPLSTQPAFVSVSQPMAPQQGQNLPCPFNPFSTRQTGEKIFWTPVQPCNEPRPSDANSATTTTDKPTETEAPAQVMDTAENSVANAPSEGATRMEQPKQQQQQQPQPQPQQEPQQTEAIPQTAEQNQNPDQVQILPQALVDGAINVAATAYSTAWNALNNLRPKEGEASEFDPVFENNMAMLVEMGFNNLERNARLLKRFNNDISQVIGVICSTGGGCHNLDID